MLRPKHQLGEGRSMRDRTFKRSSQEKALSVSGRGYKTTVEHLTKIFSNLEINRPKHDLPPLMVQVKHTKAESFFNDGAFMKTYAKGLGQAKTECFICQEKGQTLCDHSNPLSTGFKTGTHWTKTNYGSKAFRTGNLPQFPKTKPQTHLMSKTLDAGSKSSDENKSLDVKPLFGLRTKDKKLAEGSFDQDDKEEPGSEIKTKGEAIIISNEGYRNILDNAEVSRENAKVKPSTQRSGTRTKRGTLANNSIVKLDLKEMRNTMIDELKFKANNDNERPYLESMMKPRNKEKNTTFLNSN